MTVPTLEVLPSYVRHNITHALFDFDGTLSLIRDGWTEIMLELFCEEVEKMDCCGSPVHRRKYLLQDIVELTGHQTIIQMQRLAERVKQFGGTPKDPEEYKSEFVRRLEKKIEAVIFGLQSGELNQRDYVVSGAHDFLMMLATLQIKRSLFSGTDFQYVQRDAALLGIIGHFPINRMFGATPDLQASSKKSVIQKVLNENRITGDNLVVFGDGLVEIQEAKSVGALAVGVASKEGVSGERDEAKRNRLVEAGADLIITDYQKFDLWMPMVIGE